MPLRVGAEARQVDHGEVRAVLPVETLAADKHSLREKAVPSVFGNDPDAQPVPRVGPRVEVLGKEFFGLGGGQHIAFQGAEVRF